MMRFIIGVLFSAVSAGADGHSDVFGVWGTKAQCDEKLLVEGGTLRAAPFGVSDGWLKHRDVWCALTWYPAQPRATGVFVSSSALCGEDSQRAYRLDMVLVDEELTLIWDEALLNGPLGRCSVH